MKWLLDAALPARALPRWQALQREIGNRLVEFGADPNARDASRVLRLAGTANSKSRRSASILDYDGQRLYDFNTLCAEILPFSREQLADLRAGRTAGHQQPRETLHLPAGWHCWGPRTLAWDRFIDLRHLAEMRGWDIMGVPEGRRDAFILWSLNFFARGGVVDSGERFWQEGQALVATYCPNWRESWQSMMGALHRRLFISREDAYKITNDRLIDTFAISSEEETKLKTIISKAEKRRRNARRSDKARRAAGALVRGEYLSQARQRVAEVMRLHGLGWPASRIAKAVNLSSRSVRRILSAQQAGFLPDCHHENQGVWPNPVVNSISDREGMDFTS